MKKKGILIAIIVLVVLLVLAGGAFAYVYFATDLLKSDKELFSKYMVQMGDNENGFFPKVLEEYNNKKNTTAYENSGSISVNTTITADTATNKGWQEISNVIEKANVSNIGFSGKVDNANKKVEQNIILNYSDTDNFSFKYKQDGDIYGLQSDIVSPGYIAFENNNLQEFAKKLGQTDVSNIPNKIEFPKINSLKLTDEEKSHIMQQYIAPAFEGLPDEKFSKTENSDGSCTYTLSVTNIELRDIFVQMLNTLKNDTMLLNKFNTILQEVYSTYNQGANITDSSMPKAANEILNNQSITANLEEDSISITPEKIDETIKNLNEQNLKEMIIPIGLTQKDGIVNRISMIQDDVKVYVDKKQTEGNITYNVSTEFANTQENGGFTLNISYSGLNTNSVTENASLGINREGIYNATYSYQNAFTFGNAVNIEGFGQDTAVLNNYNAEQIAPLLTQVTLMIAQNNSELMNKIGFPAEMINPLVIAVSAPALIESMVSSENLLESTQNGREMSNEMTNVETESMANETVVNIVN